jgi:hypothetical protein
MGILTLILVCMAIFITMRLVFLLLTKDLINHNKEEGDKTENRKTKLSIFGIPIIKKGGSQKWQQ